MAKITIFGLAGTGKSTAGKILQSRMGYAFVSTGSMFRTMAEKQGLSLADFEILSNSDDKYDRELDKQTEEYGKVNDNFIFDSRLAWYFIPDSFKVKLDCDFDTRTQRISERENKDVEQVRAETKSREDLITERYKKYYGIEDFSNNKNFDFIVDTRINNAEQVVDLIVGELKNRKLI
ncbi:MAG: cytidylate kinase family protein [bacterium]